MNRFKFLWMMLLCLLLGLTGCDNNNEDFVVTNSSNVNTTANVNNLAQGRFVLVTSVTEAFVPQELAPGAPVPDTLPFRKQFGNEGNFIGDFSLDGAGNILPGTQAAFVMKSQRIEFNFPGGTYFIAPDGNLTAQFDLPFGTAQLVGNIVGGASAAVPARFATAVINGNNGANFGEAYIAARGTGLDVGDLNGTYNLDGQHIQQTRYQDLVVGEFTFDGNGSITAASLVSSQLRAGLGGSGPFTLQAPATYTVDNDGDFSADLLFGLFTYQIRGVVGADGQLIATAVIPDVVSGTIRLQPQGNAASLAGISSRAIRAQGTTADDGVRNFYTSGYNNTSEPGCPPYLELVFTPDIISTQIANDGTFEYSQSYLPFGSSSGIADVYTFQGNIDLENINVDGSANVDITVSLTQQRPPAADSTVTATISNKTVLLAATGNLVIDFETSFPSPAPYALEKFRISMVNPSLDSIPTTPEPPTPVATTINYSVQPSLVPAATTFGTPLTIEVLDQNGSLLTNDNTTQITLSLNPPPDSTATLGGTLTATAVNGIVTFDDLSVSEPGEGFTLTATSGNLSQVVSSSFDVISAPTGIVAIREGSNDVSFRDESEGFLFPISGLSNLTFASEVSDILQVDELTFVATAGSFGATDSNTLFVFDSNGTQQQTVILDSGATNNTYRLLADPFQEFVFLLDFQNRALRIFNFDGSPLSEVDQNSDFPGNQPFEFQGTGTPTGFAVERLDGIDQMSGLVFNFYVPNSDDTLSFAQFDPGFPADPTREPFGDFSVNLENSNRSFGEIVILSNPFSSAGTAYLNSTGTDEILQLSLSGLAMDLQQQEQDPNVEFAGATPLNGTPLPPVLDSLAGRLFVPTSASQVESFEVSTFAPTPTNPQSITLPGVNPLPGGAAVLTGVGESYLLVSTSAGNIVSYVINQSTGALEFPEIFNGSSTPDNTFTDPGELSVGSPFLSF